MEIALNSSDIDRLRFYSPIHFIRGNHSETYFQNHVCLPCIQRIEDEKHCFRMADSCLIFDELKWDTEYFGFPCYRILYILGNSPELVLKSFLNSLAPAPKRHVFMQVPSEDSDLFPILSKLGFYLCETRMNYWQDISSYHYSERFSVRFANEKDSEILGKIARKMRNKYDRFHADPALQFKADDFLQVYAEQSVLGLADCVLMPHESGISSQSFLTARYLQSNWKSDDIAVSKMVLSAVDADENRGWYRKLISEMSYHLKEKGAQYVFMNTQSANHAVIRVWESLGYRFGSADHIFSIVV